MEKAYSKIHMNYDRIIAGSGIEGLRALTGMPVRNYNHGNNRHDQSIQNMYKNFA